MIQPTIGRVVWFRPNGMSEKEQAHAALITFVHSDTVVNLAVFGPNGIPYAKTSVYLKQSQYELDAFMDYCEWMPYQIGQAAKATV